MSLDKRFELRISRALLRRVDEWRREQLELVSRSEAMRRLIALGMGIGVHEEKRQMQIEEAGAMRDLAPPWVLFTDDGKPVAILPAGRPGEVANVEGLTLEQAGAIVEAANSDHTHDRWMARMGELHALLEKF